MVPKCFRTSLEGIWKASGSSTKELDHAVQAFECPNSLEHLLNGLSWAPITPFRCLTQEHPSHDEFNNWTLDSRFDRLDCEIDGPTGHPDFGPDIAMMGSDARAQLAKSGLGFANNKCWIYLCWASGVTLTESMDRPGQTLPRGANRLLK